MRHFMPHSSLLITAAGTLFAASAANANTVSLGTATPDVGDGVQNLNFSTSAADLTTHSFVDSDYIGSTNTLWVGQAFTTGTNTDGYDLNSISVRQVSWGPTNWDFDGGTVSLRLFEVTSTDGSLYFTNEIGSAQTVAIPSSTAATIGGTPVDPVWLTFNLDTTVSLNASSQYAFAFLSTGLEDGSNNEFLLEVDGTNSDVYAGGTSITVDGTTILWRGGSGSDRAFVVNLTAVPEPGSMALLGMGSLLVAARRRRN